MVTKAYSLFDSKAAVFSPPYFMATSGLALRTFTELANDLKTNVGRYPADFTLFQVGEFDDNTGILTPIVPLVNLGIAVTFVREIQGGR